LTDRRAPPECKVSIASKFLTEKAYDFYLLNASIQPHRWLWHEFVEALFNHCFPADFRMQQRSKLNNFKQKELSVKEYVSQLYELFIIMGLDIENANDECTMADKLWQGLRTEIQEQLWLSNLNPDLSSFENIRMTAERIEMAQSVVMTKQAHFEKDDTYNTVRLVHQYFTALWGVISKKLPRKPFFKYGVVTSSSKYHISVCSIRL
jgi:hypothetical protein